MSKKKYKLTEEHKQKISQKLKGRHISPNTEFKKGEKKEPFTKEHKRKIKENHANFHGEKSPLWKGGITPLNHALRANSLFKIWREAVFLRDNFTCQNLNCLFCENKIGVYLQAHHIKPFVLFPELRFNIDNGITYCKGFHINSKTLHRGILKIKTIERRCV